MEDIYIRDKRIFTKNNKETVFKDNTQTIKSMKYDGNLYHVNYGKSVYTYCKENVLIKPCLHKVECKDNMQIKIKGKKYNIKECYMFNDCYKVFYDDTFKVLSKDNYNKSVLEEISDLDTFKYFKELSATEEFESDDKEGSSSYLYGEIQKLEKASFESMLYKYLSTNKESSLQDIKKNNNDSNIIFPFHFNLSQRDAVYKALQNNVTVIEGPPGTGKTQTILNLIANIIMQDKTVAVVSSNNEAVNNVYNKMNDKGFGFFVADLGREEKRKQFINNQPCLPDDFESWKMNDIESEMQELKNIEKKMIRCLNIEKEMHQNNMLKNLYELESQHFQKYNDENDNKLLDLLKNKKFSSKKITKILAKFDFTFRYDLTPSVFSKALWAMKLGVPYNELKDNLYQVPLHLKQNYYETKINELNNQIEEALHFFKDNNYNDLKKQYKEKVDKVFKAKLYKKFKRVRTKYKIDDFLKKKYTTFLKDYPVTLSTTYSIYRSKSKDSLFDYIIVDESSQVDLITALLTLGSCKNIIVVGDDRQLSHIVTKVFQQKNEKLRERFNIDDYFNYETENILTSIKKAFPNAESILLKEHYRCHPMIINFCNRKYYDNQLVIHSEYNTEAPFVLLRTAKGNHMRCRDNGKFNMREIEAIKEELPHFENISMAKDIGFISSYRMQVTKAKEELSFEDIDTVHKFQGKEKLIIIFSTVIDETKKGQQSANFVTNERLVNVALSRAVRAFILVTNTDALTKTNNDIADLIYYILYYSSVSEVYTSKIISVFDLLYKDYAKELENLNSKLINRFRFKSENIMYTYLIELLKKNKYKKLGIAPQYRVRDLFMNTAELNEEEMKYLKNGNSKIDFLLYETIGNNPILAIEVNGFYWHERIQKGRQRDEMKKQLFEKKDFPFIQLRTNESKDAKLEEIIDKAIIKMNDRKKEELLNYKEVKIDDLE